MGLPRHHGGHHHDRTAATRTHGGQRGPGHLQRAEEIGVHDLAPLRQIDVLEALEGVEAERVVDQHVDAAELLHPGRHQTGAGLGVGDVGRHGDGAGPERRHLGQDLVEGRLPPRRQHEVRPVRGQGLRRLPAQPGPTPETTHTLPDNNPARAAGCLFALRSRHGRSVGQGGDGLRAIRAGVTRA